MKRSPFYRRQGKRGKYEGLKERMCWRLSKGPAMGAELAATFNIPLVEFNRIITKRLLTGSAVAVVTATEWEVRPDGIKDRLYTLERLGTKATAFPKAGKSILVSKKSLTNMHQGMKEKNIEAAKRRARLIKAGLYIDEMG